jgi:hypothetical protein
VAAEDFDPAFFTDADSAVVDNPWFPLVPGTQFVYEGSALEDGDRIPRRVVITVTDLTKVIGGVRTRVSWDLDYANDELVEAELAFFAQDNGGNVWHLGQYPEEYEEGEFAKAPAWFHGLAGAAAGIAMHVDPQLGEPSYAQGFAPPPVDWTDRGRVYKVDQRTCVPTDCYDGVLVVEEFERSKPKAFQLKYYAPGIGNVRVGWRGRNEEEREILKLVELVLLDPDALAKARDQALALEQHAYETRPKLYGQMPPMETS